MPGSLRRTIGLIVSFLAFQGAWFSCVLGAARGQPGVGVAVVVLVWGVHLALSPARRQDLWLAGAALAMGLLWDTAMLRTGVVEYAAPGNPQEAMLVLGLGWAVMTPLLAELARRLAEPVLKPHGSQ